MYILLILMAFLNSPQTKTVEIKDAWIRPGAKGMNSALYFEVINNQKADDTLYNVKSDLAEITEMHETYKKGEMMGMRRTGAVVVKQNGSFKFQPGGHHVMLIRLKKIIREGSTENITLFFKKAGKITVKAKVMK